MKCYFCKEEIDEAIRTFVKARNGREKDNFRDLCLKCYKAEMEAQGKVCIIDEPDFPSAPCPRCGIALEPHEAKVIASTHLHADYERGLLYQADHYNGAAVHRGEILQLVHPKAIKHIQDQTCNGDLHVSVRTTGGDAKVPVGLQSAGLGRNTFLVKAKYLSQYDPDLSSPPIPDCGPDMTHGQGCEYRDPEDGTCTHPTNRTPECHPDTCPYSALAQRLGRLFADVADVPASP